MSIRTIIPLFLLLIASFTPIGAAEQTGRVVGVTDGDTISVLLDGTAIRVRLDGIDCPEARQPFGNRAKQMTSELAFGKTVTIVPRGNDRYGRLIAEVLLPDGRSLNRELVKAGLAWWYRKYAPKDSLLEQLETESRNASRGLWSDPNAIPPWAWRHPAASKVLEEVP